MLCRCLQLEECLRAAGIPVPQRPTVGSSSAGSAPAAPAAGVTPVMRAAARLGVQLGEGAGDLRNLLARPSAMPGVGAGTTTA